MRKFAIFALLCIAVLLNAQIAQADTLTRPDDIAAVGGESPPVAVENLSTSAAEKLDIQGDLWSALSALWDLLNLGYILTFIGIAWLIDTTGEAKNVARWFDWWGKIPKTLRYIGVGSLWAVVYWWAFSIQDKMAVLGLLVSLLASIIICKLGIMWALQKVASMLGVKFELPKTQQ